MRTYEFKIVGWRSHVHLRTNHFNPGKVMCGKCGKPVEREERWEDEGRGKLRITVYCHGDVETSEISVEELRRNAPGIRFGTAFRT